MLEIEIDGKTAQVADGSTVIEAAQQLGVYIPHFCYHKKLSIAANCRMCLVQVEKAPKPLPACATPVTNGMKVFTHSELAVKAQKGVMEFLLINHPLDCPICDQGGECQLQDLAVGYGDVKSRFQEEKRVVIRKEVGPLISMEEMARCIHCTRCVRFGQEIAGVMELGMGSRSNYAEIQTFVGRSIDSELSGNMIDLCPVGALTSKPFRYSARSWELARRRSIAPHDSLGANLVVQVKNGRVMRVLPAENEAVNECWLSDKDRFSYEGLNSGERLTRPMVRQDGRWHEVDWNVALDYAAHGLKDIAREQGADALAALAAPTSTLEELYLLQKLMRGLGSPHIDSRPRQSDFRADGQRKGVPWLGMPVADLSTLDAALVVGSFLRKDHPLMAQRLRAAARRGARVCLLTVAGDDPLLPLAVKSVVAPAKLPTMLAGIAKAIATMKGAQVAGELAAVEPCGNAQRIAEHLCSAGERKAVLLGNVVAQHPQASLLQALAQEISRLSGARFGFLGEAANTVGAYVARAVPGDGGLNASAMFASPRAGYLLFNLEPEYDCANPQAALAALRNAKLVVMATAFRNRAALDYADVLLPIAPFAETSGTYVNAEGRAQGFHGVAKPAGEARPGWKVLRVLGNLLGLSGFSHESSEQVRAEMLPEGDGVVSAGLDNAIAGIELSLPAAFTGLQRIADVPIYRSDALVRHASSLQLARDSAPASLRAAPATLVQLGLTAGDRARVRQGGGQAELSVIADEGVPAACVRVAAACEETTALGGMFDAIEVERA
jgi:NADH-quinone oxidoreductase subunit G